MKTLKIADVEIVEAVPVHWIRVSENGWGYLALLELQSAGHRDRIARVRRDEPASKYRQEVDADATSYVEEAGAAYHHEFLNWSWYFKQPASSVNPWGAVNQVLATSVRAPRPHDVRAAMKGCINELYA